MEREACVCDHGFERSDLCAEIIIIIIIITDETYSRRQINTGTKFEVSHLHNIFVDIGQSGPSMD